MCFRCTSGIPSGNRGADSTVTPRAASVYQAAAITKAAAPSHATTPDAAARVLTRTRSIVRVTISSSFVADGLDRRDAGRRAHRANA
jgi:hypothetical protein